MDLQRKNISKLTPYTCARDIYKSGIFLDANENYKQWVAIDWSKIKNLNRYPDSTSDKLREKLARTYIKCSKNNVFVGSGSDEIIDLLIKAFVENNEFIMVMNPTYSIYKIQANINNVLCKQVFLNADFTLDVSAIKKNVDDVKIIFLCSPNNPTGSLVKKAEVENVLKFFKGLVVIDEAYIEFAGTENSLVDIFGKNSRVVILRTFSKAWGLAGIRVGYAIGDSTVINTLLKIKESYNLSKVSQEIALQALDQINNLKNSVSQTMRLKKQLQKKLNAIGFETISNKANFVLLRVKNAKSIYQKLSKKGIITRDKSSPPLLENVLRITVGTNTENAKLLQNLKSML